MANLLDKKVRTLFVRFDMNSSGSIDENDFEQWSSKLIAFGNLDANKQTELRAKILLLWKSYFAPADRDNDGKVELEELSEYIKKAINDQSKRDTLQETLPLIFDAVDVNKDGTISKEEFANYFKSLNITDSQASEQVFEAMDVDSDHAISKNEFTEFGKKFFSSQTQEDPSKLFFGPLV